MSKQSNPISFKAANEVTPFTAPSSAPTITVPGDVLDMVRDGAGTRYVIGTSDKARAKSLNTALLHEGFVFESVKEGDLYNIVARHDEEAARQMLAERIARKNGNA